VRPRPSPKKRTPLSNVPSVTRPPRTRCVCPAQVLGAVHPLEVRDPHLAERSASDGLVNTSLLWISPFRQRIAAAVRTPRVLRRCPSPVNPGPRRRGDAGGEVAVPIRRMRAPACESPRSASRGAAVEATTTSRHLRPGQPRWLQVLGMSPTETAPRACPCRCRAHSVAARSAAASTADRVRRADGAELVPRGSTAMSTAGAAPPSHLLADVEHGAPRRARLADHDRRRSRRLHLLAHGLDGDLVGVACGLPGHGARGRIAGAAPRPFRKLGADRSSCIGSVPFLQGPGVRSAARPAPLDWRPRAYSITRTVRLLARQRVLGISTAVRAVAGASSAERAARAPADRERPPWGAVPAELWSSTWASRRLRQAQRHEFRLEDLAELPTFELPGLRH